MAWKQDAFQHPWDHLSAYAFSPFALLKQVLSKVVLSTGLSLVLMALLLQGVVRRPLVSVGWRTAWASAGVEFIGAAPYAEVPLRPKNPQASHVEVVQHLVWKAGFSKEVALVAAANLGRSTAALCQSKCSRFLDWCDWWSIDPCKASAPWMAEFFPFLHRVLGFVPAVKGHQPALTYVFSLMEMGLAASTVISWMFHSFERLCPSWEIRPLDWNLSLVVGCLSRPPFEPLKLASDKHLTWKTSSLLTLALTNAFSPFALLKQVLLKVVLSTRLSLVLMALLLQGVVRRPLVSVGWRTAWASAGVEFIGAAPYAEVPSRPKNPQASHVEVVQHLVWKAGFSKEVALVAAANLGRSTAALCQSKCSRFLDWCDWWSIDPCKASAPWMAEFFPFLHRVLGFVPAVKGHQPALTYVFSLMEMGLAASTVISWMFHSFERLCPSWEITTSGLELISRCRMFV